ncbi:hypothetical protein L596_021263 [Steinernema carpocapsae]|uniref:Uncharacterized protein n=1 Tax=Steinernema carpocapsae TaxID=34508 RepID=A0A4U5MI90_STECR|nr:hypothetical protein L596_021263 [Steinernema carpocapsae]
MLIASLSRIRKCDFCTTINVDRSHVGITGEGASTTSMQPMYESSRTPRPRNNTRSSFGSKTPMYAAHQTPMYGSQTPMHDNFGGGRTPHYGSQTPAYDGSRTPLHSGSNWDPQVSNTPAHNSSGYDFDYDDDTDASTPGSNESAYAWIRGAYG